MESQKDGSGENDDLDNVTVRSTNDDPHNVRVRVRSTIDNHYNVDGRLIYDDQDNLRV